MSVCWDVVVSGDENRASYREIFISVVRKVKTTHKGIMFRQGLPQV